MLHSIKKATRKDVAELAGVSETIVSYVINQNRYVAEEKRERVLNAVRQLNYRPNSIARALKGKPSRHIIFVADDIANEHFGKLVAEMDKLTYDQEYMISLSSNRNTEDFVSRLISRQPDGIIISSVSFQENYIQRIVNSGIPVVLIGNRIYENVDKRIAVVSSGLLNGMRDSVKLLASKGRKNIIYIDRISPNGFFSNMNDLRYRGFTEQMQESKLPFSRDSIFTGYTTEDELCQALIHRIKSGAKIDGIIARNDNLAAVAMTSIQGCGLNVPKDVSVIGFDNSRISKLTTPKLTTVQIDRIGMSRAILHALHNIMDGTSPKTQSLKTILIQREST